MDTTKITGALLAVLLVTAGTAAALPGNAPADTPATDEAQASNTTHTPAATQPTDEASDDGNESATDEPRRGPPATQNRHGPPADRGNAEAHEGRRGPPVDMPDQVPDFVTQIHQLIRQHLSGVLDVDLGSAIADVVPGDAAQDEQHSARPDDETATEETPTDTPEGDETTTDQPTADRPDDRRATETPDDETTTETPASDR